VRNKYIFREGQTETVQIMRPIWSKHKGQGVFRTNKCTCRDGGF